MKSRFLFFTSIIFFSFFSCNSTQTKEVIVDFADTADLAEHYSKPEETPAFVAVSAMTSPSETFKQYHELLNYISKKVGRHFFFKQKKDYDQVNKMLINSEVDFAFICSGAYVEPDLKESVKILVVPVIDGSCYYQAYIIVNKNSNINTFEELKFKTFAYTDPLSQTGRKYPKYLLKQLDYTEKIFFSKIIYTAGHDISIQMINKGLVEGASVNSLIYNYIAKNTPENVKNIKIIDKSEFYGVPPVVYPKTLSEKNVEIYRKVFLDMHKDSLGKKILAKLMIEKYIFSEDTLYDNTKIED